MVNITYCMIQEPYSKPLHHSEVGPVSMIECAITCAQNGDCSMYNYLEENKICQIPDSSNGSTEWYISTDGWTSFGVAQCITSGTVKLLMLFQTVNTPLHAADKFLNKLFEPHTPARSV